MLNWVTGAPRAQQDESLETDDAPDTPAHVFAARAFKSLLFGTPAPNEVTVEKSKKFNRLSNLGTSTRGHSADSVLEQTARPVMLPRHSDPMASPSKGILVAPGSVSGKRKSVTFGGLSGEGDGVEVGGEGEREVPPALVSSPTKVRVSGSQQDLRRTLFEQRGGSSGDKRASVEPVKQEMNVEKERKVIDVAMSKEKATIDVQPTQAVSLPTEERTIDLNQPRSTSGQHWKREYERDHDNSKAEMKRLIQYSQMTKSYAEKRDRDAVTMTQRLNAAETKAKSLEKKIQKLTAQLMDAKTQGGDQDSILNEVANQTAEVMKYQSKAERYRAALRRNEVLQSSTDEEEETGQKVPSTEIASLKSELARLKLAAEKAGSHASKLEKENVLLNDKVKEMKASRILQGQQYDEMSSRLKKKEARLQDDNLRLNRELRSAKAETATLKEQLLAMSTTNPISTPKSQRAQEKLFDLSCSRLIKESTPPTSDEELRSKISPSLRGKIPLSEPPTLDFSLTKETHLPKPDRTDRRRSQVSVLDDTFSIAKSTLGTTHKPQPPLYKSTVLPSSATETDVCIDLSTEFPTPAVPGLGSPRKSSPLMKSFIDDLGSRRPLPPERIAAARKRLEEKAAIRRGTPKNGNRVAL